MIELSGTRDARRQVRRLPADQQAADVIRAWSGEVDTTIDLSDLDASGVDLTDADLSMGLFFDVRLEGAILVGADLYRAQLGRAVLDRADLARASLVKAVLDGVKMVSTGLSEADLGSAELYEVDARSASFRGARLNGASFLSVRLEGADLTGATVAATKFDALLDEETAVQGLSGTIYGPARVSENGVLRELDGLTLELWLNHRGASVGVINSPPEQTTYYALIGEGNPRSNPEGVVRRRRAGEFVSDEVFTRNLRWEPTEYLRRYELGHNDLEHVEITKDEVDRFISLITRQVYSER
ncbi:pentapeptide repeat-containing protein [Streptomyces seoulensis]|uniref:pentapeptide repeat-containing protein n=1 Tax=Streptomyces seoulensis TaxID=73044 RepID=UPI0033A1DAA5